METTVTGSAITEHSHEIMAQKSDDDETCSSGSSSTPAFQVASLFSRLNSLQVGRKMSEEDCDMVMMAKGDEDTAGGSATLSPDGVRIPIGRKPRRRAILKVWKTMIGHCLSCVLLLVPHQALVRMDDNKEDRVSVLGAFVLSCFLAPSIVHAVGYKWIMVIFFVLECGYVICMYYGGSVAPHVAAAVLGFSLGPFWVAQSCYIAVAAAKYAAAKNYETLNVLPKFYGIFYAVANTARLVGTPVAYGMLGLGLGENNTRQKLAFNVGFRRGTNDTCGAEYCGSVLLRRRLGDNSSVTPETILHATGDEGSREELLAPLRIMTAVYLVCCLLAALIGVVLVDDLRPRRRTQSQMSRVERLLSTVLMHCQRKMLPLLVIIVYNGMQDTFFLEYLNSFVLCAGTRRWVIYAALTFASSGILACVVIAFLERYVTRVVLYKTALALNVIGLVLMLRWRPSERPFGYVLLLPAVWGVGNAVWQTTSCSMIAGIFFHCREPAFATYRLWRTVGVLAALLYSDVLCMRRKIWLTLGTLLLGSVLYVWTEVQHRRDLRRPYFNLRVPIVQ